MHACRPTLAAGQTRWDFGQMGCTCMRALAGVSRVLHSSTLRAVSRQRGLVCGGRERFLVATALRHIDRH